MCLEDGELLTLLHFAAQDFARGEVPPEVMQLFTLASMTAIRKVDGGVRGIAIGTVFRRLVAKCLSQQYISEVEKVCAPFQFAMSTRAGTDCVGHAIRAMTDLNPRTTVLSIDGVGAYDHVFRSSMLRKLHEVGNLRGLLPFVRCVYSQPSTYHWQDEDGTRRVIRQSEGGEQGDPLMPLLFCLAVHDALAEVKEQFWMVRSFSRSSTTCTRCALQNGCGRSMICSRRSCSRWQASGHTLGRRARGTKSAKFPIEWRNWARQCGALQG